MEIRNFVKLLYKHKYTLVAVPVVAVIIAYFLVRNQPSTYSSQGQIATGIVDQTQQVLNTENAQESKISQEFSNLIQMMHSEKVLNQVSYKLMIHDLTSKKPFLKPSKLVSELNYKARVHGLKVYTELYKTRMPLSLFDKDQKGLNTVLESMGYDDQSLMKKLIIYRADNSDFINVQFDAQDPELAAFVVNTLCEEFIKYYTELVKESQRKAATFLSHLLTEKQDSLRALNEGLKQYKIRNRVFSLSEQALSLYGQIADFETRKEQAEKDVISTRAAIDKIDSQFDPSDRQYLESSLNRINTQITSIDGELNAANSAYVESGFAPEYKARVDSLNTLMGSKIRQASDKYILNPLSAKQDLVTTKLKLQTENVIAKNSIGSIDKELARLNRRFDSLVPHEAVVGSFEKAIDIAQQEYLALLAKYNQVSMEASMSVRLKQVLTAMPGIAQPSKKLLLVIIGGLVSFVFCTIVLFIMFFLDDSIKTGKELAARTKMPVLGHLNLLSNSTIDFKKIWDANEGNNKTRLFKNLLRSIRYEIDKEMSGNKILLINSLSASEGKTLLSISLAYSHAIINQRVLLIDGNFENPGITETVKTDIYIEDFVRGKLEPTDWQSGNMLNIWGNRGGDVSLFEIASEHQVRHRLEELKAYFDIIIVESSALTTLNRAKEWVAVTDKMVAVFEAGQKIKESIKPNIQYLKLNRDKFAGWVLNKVVVDAESKRKRKKK